MTESTHHHCIRNERGQCDTCEVNKRHAERQAADPFLRAMTAEPPGWKVSAPASILEAIEVLIAHGEALSAGVLAVGASRAGGNSWISV